MKTVLFDLDGTLTDPRDGIIRCIQYALEKGGYPVPPEEELLWCIGPPLYESFPQLAPGVTEAGVHELVALYRERFAVKGMYENAVYPGILDLLRQLQGRKQLFVATSKPHFYARKIAEHFGFAEYFQHVHGSELSGVRSKKGDLVKYILEHEGLAPEDCVMIGDRYHDINGGKAAGTRTIGITWGYGSREELREAGANQIVDQPADLLAALRIS